MSVKKVVKIDITTHDLLKSYCTSNRLPLCTVLEFVIEQGMNKLITEGYRGKPLGNIVSQHQVNNGAPKVVHNTNYKDIKDGWRNTLSNDEDGNVSL